MTNTFIIPLNGLPTGQTKFNWQANKEFFDGFGNSDVLDSLLNITLNTEKTGNYLGINCNIDGYIMVECDRCLDEVKLPINKNFKLSVKFGDEPTAESPLDDNGYEVVFFPLDSPILDLSQIIYDYSILELPIQRVHKNGECNPEVIQILNKTNKTEEITDSPFAKLKGLFKEN